MRNRTLVNLDEQWYSSVESNIRSFTMRDDVNSATLQKFGKRWVRNLSRNSAAIRDLPGISRLAGLAAGDNPLPVFLAAAGPGLDSIALLLPEIRRRCIIVAVDTSLRFLHRHGMYPDFAVVVDPQFWNSRHLNRCVSPHTRLIDEAAVYPPVLHLPFREMYLCGSLYPLGTFIEQRVDPKGNLGAGGSVATTAWDFSRTLGARQIWIAGLDLAFPGLKTHYRGAQFEEKALCESVRLNPAETWLFHALRDGSPFFAPALCGGQVLTDRRLSLYASWFKNRFRQFPAISNYSLSAGGTSAESGLAIERLEPAAKETFLALPDCRAEIDRRLEQASSRIKAEFFEPEIMQLRSNRYENAIAALTQGLEQIKGACEKGIAIAENALRQEPHSTKREKTLADLDSTNRCIAESEVKEIAGFLFQDTIEPNLSEDEPASFRRYLISSIHLYQSLKNAATLNSLDAT